MPFDPIVGCVKLGTEVMDSYNLSIKMVFSVSELFNVK